MILPSEYMWQCHSTCGPAIIVNMKVICHFPFILFMTYILDPLSDVSYTGMEGGVLDEAKAEAFRDTF